MGGMKGKKTGKFVIQRHERQNEPLLRCATKGRQVHWDLMLEKGGVLETYRVNSPPEEWGDNAPEATRIFDHPLKFLTYEGSVNKGKGKVTIVEAGIYRILSQKENQLEADFEGTIIKGKKEIIFATGGCRVQRG
ncbi:MAG: DNA polymerase ligase N-terminal domain-containing protein [Planctomycetota bacterium]